MPMAFVLGGGGAKGDFEVGALLYLYSMGLEPGIICGTSVGAINAAKIAEGKGGIAGLAAIWLDRMNSNEDMYRREQWLAEIEDSKVLALIERSFKQGLFKSLVAGLDYDARVHQVFPPWMVKDIIEAGIDIGRLADALERVQTAQSAFNIQPIRDVRPVSTWLRRSDRRRSAVDHREHRNRLRARRRFGRSGRAAHDPARLQADERDEVRLRPFGVMIHADLETAPGANDGVRMLCDLPSFHVVGDLGTVDQ